MILPPTCEEMGQRIEECLLGALLHANVGPGQALDIVTPLHFGDFRRRAVFEAIRTLHHDGRAVDLQSVTVLLVAQHVDELVGAPGYLSYLLHSHPQLTAAQVEDLAACLAEREPDLHRNRRPPAIDYVLIDPDGALRWLRNTFHEVHQQVSGGRNDGESGVDFMSSCYPVHTYYYVPYCTPSRRDGRQENKVANGIAFALNPITEQMQDEGYTEADRVTRYCGPVAFIAGNADSLTADQRQIIEAAHLRVVTRLRRRSHSGPFRSPDRPASA